MNTSDNTSCLELCRPLSVMFLFSYCKGKMLTAGKRESWRGDYTRDNTRRHDTTREEKSGREYDILQDRVNLDVLMISLKPATFLQRGKQGSSERQIQWSTQPLTSETGLTEPVKLNSEESIWVRKYVSMTFRLERNWTEMDRMRTLASQHSAIFAFVLLFCSSPLIHTILPCLSEKFWLGLSDQQT